MVVGTVLPFVGVLARRRGASPELLAVLSVAPFLGFLMAAPAARFSGHVRWGVLVAVQKILSRAVLICAAWVNGALGLVLMAMGFHAVTGAGLPFGHGLLKTQVHGRAQPDILKWIRVLALGASVPVAWVAGKLLDTHPDMFRWLFPCAGIVGVLTAIPFLGLRPRPGESGAEKKTPGLLDEVRVLRRDTRFALFLLVYYIGAFGEKVTMPVQAIYFADILDLRYEEVGLAMGIWSPLLAIAGFFFWARCLRTVRPVPMLAACVLIKATRPVLWALAPETSSPLLYVIIGQCVFQFVIAGLEMGSIVAVLRMSDRGDAPAYVGIHFFLMGTRGLLGPALGLTLYRAGMSIPGMYGLVAAIVLTGGLALAGLVIAGRPRPG
jgi:hypothetical protein